MKAHKSRMPSPTAVSGPRRGHLPDSLRAVGAALIQAFLVLLWAQGNPVIAQYSAIKVPEGYVQVEGDIIMTEAKAAALRMELPGPRPAFVYAPSRLWPNRVVPFDFDAGVTTAERAIFQAAMAAWSNSYPGVITIRFQPRNDEAGFLHFAVTDPGFIGGVTDYVGYSGDQVTITVHPQAVTTFLIAHEIGHALGLWHEQSRNDRDSYVTVITNNIMSGYASQFDKKSPQSTFGAYDYDSLMHYSACAFDKCTACSCDNPVCRTIEVAAQYSSQQCHIGQQHHLSAMDARSMAFMYGPPDWRFLYFKSGIAADGSFQQPFRTVAQAVVGTPAGSTLWLGPGTHAAAGVTISTPMILRAALADLQMQIDGTLGPSSAGYATLR